MFSHIHFQSIGVTDTARALVFYRDKLDFEVERDSPYNEDRWIFMRVPGAKTLLHFDKLATLETTEKPVLILASEDVDAACQKLAGRGVVPISGPGDAPWEPGTRWAMIKDSEGNLILIQTIKGSRDHG
ncbi:VOC family protein [Devosia rhodophyticola]|uniref:VOC family protein n=1 Tax=Devosia rhodophyticola TaxID=3026423 RepID=A0ABY7Z129_9HYPH|nr:VOC family protein [Devosia rhodophyticola]WDR07187.1 VOC family protein [Devosia rhodophyticola]